ncbi:sulfatase-like hydrolase/transferase [Kiritimatiellaeota bacterium B1221]|nr:sulfatase-like hydrolase/transferase [Kiritimatiellaeota bacterium B1221]
MKHILFITADELRGDCLSCMGNPDVKTPHIDSLAARGTVFEKHFACFPKCVPSRCSMHTGRYAHTDGLRTVMGPNHLPGGDPTLGEFMREQGYETAVLGLNHVWEEDRFYGQGEGKNRKGAGTVDYTSFTRGLMSDLALQTRHYPAATQRTGPHLDAIADVCAATVATGEVTTFSDENRTDQACAYLQTLRDPEKPFFLQLNLSKPHPAYCIHEPYYSMVDPRTLQPFPYGEPENASLPIRAQRKWRLGEEVPEAALREIQAVYYGMIQFIDDQVGRVLDVLKQEGLAEDTLVIFSSDHGDYAGQYGINEKWDADLRDCLLQVPFIMAGPGIPQGKRIQGLSEHVDLPATIFDYLGWERPPHWVWHGQSMLPLLQGAAGKQAVFADGGHEQAMRERFDTPVWEEKNGKRIKATEGKQLTYQQCPDAMARCKMVRTPEWKLVVRETGGNELFDLEADTYEMRNLYGQPGTEEVQATLMLQLLNWCLRTDTDRPFLAEFGA